jgi:hypothetical protein
MNWFQEIFSYFVPSNITIVMLGVRKYENISWNAECNGMSFCQNYEFVLHKMSSLMPSKLVNIMFTVLARMSEKINVIWDLKCPWNWRRVERKALFFPGKQSEIYYLCVTAIWIARCFLYTDHNSTSSAVLTCWKSVFGTLLCFEKCVLYFT